MDIFALLDEVRTIARNGLTYATSPYDIERYQRLLEVASRSYAGILGMEELETRARLSAELGYVTPKVGAEGAIFDEAGRILLVKRADDGRYCLPCGWLDPNESPEDAVVREIREETGYEARILQLVGIFTRKPSADLGPHTAIAIAYLCEITGGAARESHETTGMGYWRIEDVPDWHELHERYALAAREVWRARRTDGAGENAGE